MFLCMRLSRALLPLLPLVASTTIEPLAAPVAGSKRISPCFSLNSPRTVWRTSASVNVTWVFAGSNWTTVSWAERPATTSAESDARLRLRQRLKHMSDLLGEMFRRQYEWPGVSRTRQARPPARLLQDDAARRTHPCSTAASPSPRAFATMLDGRFRNWPNHQRRARPRARAPV